MYTDIIGGYERDQLANAKKTGDQSDLDKNAFLGLLVTQMENQDPLNPTADTEFIAQLAEFTSMEQMTNISQGIDSLVYQSGQQDIFNAVNFIGKDVTAEGNSLSKTDDSVSNVYYSIQEPAADLFINVFDTTGNLVYSETLGARAAGNYEFSWSGNDYLNQNMANGQYKVSITAEGVNGEPVSVGTEVSGRVEGVSTENGQAILRLSDGRMIYLTEISQVVDPSTQEESTTEE